MKSFKFFIESYESDSQKRQEATKVFKRICSAIKDLIHNNQFEKVFKLVNGSYRVTIQNLLNDSDREYKNWMLVLSNSGNGLYNGGFGKTTTTKTKVIDLAILLAPGSTKFLDTRITGMENHFVHEYIHMFDDIESSGKAAPGDYKGSLETYYNSYSEIHAYTQEILSKVDGYVSMYKSHKNLKNKKADIFGKTANEFIQKMMNSNENYKDLLKYATEDNLKKIKSKLGEYWLERIKPL